jgi:uncharacterized membrane protein YeaQ/YmgE (transglycosylase-associated protein family)
MTILLWIGVGLAFGAMARLVMPGPEPLGLGGASLLGIGGGLLGGLVGALSSNWMLIGWNHWSVLTAIVGSLFVMFSYRAVALRWEA